MGTDKQQVKSSYDAKALVKKGFDRALVSQDSIARANIERLRRVNPKMTPSEMISYLDKLYLGSVTVTGAGAGASAAVPNLAIQIPVAITELLTYLEVSVLYVLSVAEVHGLHTEDLERKRLLVSSAFLGESLAKGYIEKVVGKVAPYWGRLIVEKFPREIIKTINKALGSRFVTLTGTRTGTLVIGKQAPLFIGAGLGAAGNAVFGYLLVRAARKILGPAPKTWSHRRKQAKSVEVL
jgi:hypothetical protein